MSAENIPYVKLVEQHLRATLPEWSKPLCGQPTVHLDLIAQFAMDALAAAGSHVVQEGQAVVDGEVFSVESADDVAWADGNLYRLRSRTDEAPLCRYCGHPIKGPAKAGECLQSEDALHRQRDGSNG